MHVTQREISDNNECLEGIFVYCVLVSQQHLFPWRLFNPNKEVRFNQNLWMSLNFHGCPIIFTHLALSSSENLAPMMSLGR